MAWMECHSWGVGPSGEGTTSNAPFDGDTMINIFSSGKQIETVIVALLVEKGLVKYEEKVATYWPEFAQGGKDQITVADVMRHSGGVPWFLNPETCEPGQVKVRVQSSGTSKMMRDPIPMVLIAFHACSLAPGFMVGGGLHYSRRQDVRGCYQARCADRKSSASSAWTGMCEFGPVCLAHRLH